MRGEYAIPPIRAAISLGSPPLARGIPQPSHRLTTQPGITPACAGNTMAGKRKTVVGEDHPRLRGEYYTNHIGVVQFIGSPPLARGILSSNVPKRLSSRITPACAGNTQIIQNYLLKIRDHPRLRGEYFSSLSHLAF